MLMHHTLQPPYYTICIESATKTVVELVCFHLNQCVCLHWMQLCCVSTLSQLQYRVCSTGKVSVFTENLQRGNIPNPYLNHNQFDNPNRENKTKKQKKMVHFQMKKISCLQQIRFSCAEGTNFQNILYKNNYLYYFLLLLSI